jgi:hypothetical protein
MEGVAREDIHDPKDDPIEDDPKEDLIEEDKVFIGEEEGDFHKPREDAEVLVVVVVEHRKRGSIEEDTLF